MTTAIITRDIELEVAFNVRHLGGYVTAGGLQTSATVIRSASLHRLAENGIETLRALRLTAIVDFRSTVERERDVTPGLEHAGIRNVHAPVYERDASPPSLGDHFNGFAAVYRDMLECGRPAYRAFAETLSEASGAVLFHCAAGKDRTGIAAALLLEVAGVSREQIVDDYSGSAERLKPAFALWEPSMEERGVSRERARKLMASDAPDMEATLDHIAARWGSAEGYLRDCGLSGATISALHARLLAP